MTSSSSDFPLPVTKPVNVAATPTLDGCLTAPTPDLVFTQNASGYCLSFCWKQASQYDIESNTLIGNPWGDRFAPAATVSFQQRINRILETLTPQQFHYPFQCAGQYLVFDITVSPLLMPQGGASQAIITGQFLYTTSEAQARELVKAALQTGLSLAASPASSSRYQQRLTQVAWNIRRSLDLDTIWRQTVDGLGQSMDFSRCLICPCESACATVTVVAEYHQPGLSSLLGAELHLANEPFLRQALDTLKPVSGMVELEGESYQCLAVATSYQDQPNGLIIVHQVDRAHRWNDSEVELIRELADQVGTGIAHASLFAAGRNLAAELQRANDSLVQQHAELEEARKQAEEASRLKSEFLANTSHELRTPLNGMIGFLKLVMDGMADDPAEQNEFIQEAYRSAVHLLGIINDILDIARIEAGKMPLDLDPVKLDDLLGDLENFTRTQIQQKNLSFEIRSPATRDDIILYGNYQRLLQVMLNLVGNAIKFTHEGGITITAEVIKKKTVVQNQEKPGAVKISVADTGIGVSLEKQDKLFQSFSQVDGSRTRQYGGTGLGLAISQKLVEAMGGVVNFYSLGEGLGSTVAFTVPLYQDPVMIADETSDVKDLLV